MARGHDAFGLMGALASPLLMEAPNPRPRGICRRKDVPTAGTMRSDGKRKLDGGESSATPSVIGKHHQFRASLATFQAVDDIQKRAMTPVVAWIGTSIVALDHKRLRPKIDKTPTMTAMWTAALLLAVWGRVSKINKFR